MPRAIEEVLRYASPVWRLVRTTKGEVTLAGVTIPKDEFIFTWLASANRDPRQFAEPERFLHHTHTEPACGVRTRHAFLYRCASFAHGGAAVALPMIIKQLPNLRVIHDDSPELFEGRFLFGFKRLPIMFDKAA